MNHIPLMQRLTHGTHTPNALAHDCGLSMVELEGMLDRLTQEGMRLVRGPDGVTLCDAREAFGALTLQWRCNRAVEHMALCDSTNRVARQRLQSGARNVLVVADHQQAGRGRRGRVWESQPGQNLLFTLVLHPAVPPDQAPRCVLLWAAAMAEVLDVQLKWPNDLVSETGHKLGGILAELELAGSKVDAVILGVGINVNQSTFPPELPMATSLRKIRGAPQDRAALLAALVAAIEAVDVTADLSAWRRRAHTLGRRVRIEGVEGIASDIREDGALLVGGEAVLTGDVELLG